MVKVINISCPGCSNKSEIYLSIDPSVIILNCPECGAPLILENSQVTMAHDDLGTKKSSIRDIIDIYNGRHNRDHAPLVSEKEIDEFLTSALEKNNYSANLATPGKERICDDDVLNLRIELEKSGDVLDFIDAL